MGDLADRLAVAELIEADLLEGVVPQVGETPYRTLIMTQPS